VPREETESADKVQKSVIKIFMFGLSKVPENSNRLQEEVRKG
jgi:hypothetical protein